MENQSKPYKPVYVTHFSASGFPGRDRFSGISKRLMQGGFPPLVYRSGGHMVPKLTVPPDNFGKVNV